MSLLRGLKTGSDRLFVDFGDFNVDMPQARFRQILRANTDAELEQMATDWVQARLPEGYFIRFHLYTRDPLNFAVQITQEEMTDDNWWPEE